MNKMQFDRSCGLLIFPTNCVSLLRQCTFSLEGKRNAGIAPLLTTLSIPFTNQYFEQKHELAFFRKPYLLLHESLLQLIPYLSYINTPFTNSIMRIILTLFGCKFGTGPE